MKDTVTRLMNMSREIEEITALCADPMNSEEELDEYRTDLYKARQALQDELVRLFTPLSEGTVARYLREVEPDVREDMCASSFCEGIRFAEKHRGIGGES